MQEGIGPRIVEPIIQASIGITAAVEHLEEHDITLDINLPVVGRQAYGTMDYLIKAKQVRASGLSPSSPGNQEICMYAAV